MPIIRYTTPTIQFKFSTVSVTDITVAYLVIKQGGRAVIERDLTTATIVHTTNGQNVVTENYLQWKLTQEETKKLSKNLDATIYCDWKLSDGTRGLSHVKQDTVDDCGKEEVL